MSELVISGLHAGIGGKEILRGVDLTVRSGEVHAVMGPNGSGKSTLSHVIMGRAGYEVTAGTVTLDGVDMLSLPTWKRAQAGLFLAFQYPTEVPGVALAEMLEESFAASGRDRSGVAASLSAEAASLGVAAALLERPVNVDLSGGEKKRNDTLQMAVLAPRIAVLDEIDSGLDVDALRAVSRRIEEASESGLGDSDPLGLLAITHYTRLLEELHPDFVHIFAAGRILESGGPELAERLEADGYAPWTDSLPSEESTGEEPGRPEIEDPFADPLV